jgi:hypothetical protein
MEKSRSLFAGICSQSGHKAKLVMITYLQDSDRDRAPDDVRHTISQMKSNARTYGFVPTRKDLCREVFFNIYLKTDCFG